MPQALRLSRAAPSTQGLSPAKRAAASSKKTADRASVGPSLSGGEWRLQGSAVVDARGRQKAPGTQIETALLPHDPDVSPLTAGEKAWLSKTVGTFNRKLNTLGLGERLPPSWTVQIEKGFADQAAYNPLMNQYTLRVSQKLLNIEDETIVAHELGHLVVQLLARAPLSAHHHLNESLADVVSSLSTGRTYVGSPDYQASRGTPTADEGAAMRYVTDQAAKGAAHAKNAGNATTLVAMAFEGDSHEGSVLTTRFLFDLRDQPALGTRFNNLLIDSIADLGRWTYDEAGQGPRQAFRDRVYSLFRANRSERVDALFDFHLMTAFLLRNASNEQQRGVIRERFEMRGGNKALLEEVLASVNGAADRKKARVTSSPLNKALSQMDFASVLTAKPLTRVEAERLAQEWSAKLRVHITVDWENPATGMATGPGRGVAIPRGLIEHPGLTADGLALMISHESAHVRGIMDEGAADDFAARHGLRALWGEEAFPKGKIPTRAFKAAYSVLLKWSQLSDNAFSVVSAEPVRLVREGTGYLSLQSRWDVFRDGFMGRPTQVGQR